MLLELTLWVICGILLCEDLVKQHRYDILKKSKITGPKTYSIVGNAFALRNLDTEQTAMGVKVNAQDNPDLEYVQALAYVTRIMGQRFINHSQRASLLFRLTSSGEYKDTQRCIAVMHKFTVDVIEKCRATLEETIKNGTYEKSLMDPKYEYGSKRRMTLLDGLLQSTLNGTALSKEDIREKVDNFMFAGHDTATSAMSFALNLISRHPHVQTKLVQEISQVLGADKNTPVSHRELQDLKYLECVIKETLRLYPSVTANGQKTTGDVVLEFILVVFVCLILWDYLHRRRNDEMFKKAGIMGPRPLPLIGSALLGLRSDTSSVFPLLNSLSSQYGKVFHAWFFGNNALFIQDHKYFESVLSSQQVIKKSLLYKMFTCWLGDGLLLSTDSKWHSRRKIITPTFHFKILEAFVEVFDQQSSVLVKRLRDKADGNTVLEMFSTICLTALDIIAETAMGVKIHAQENPKFPYAKALTDVSDILGMRVVKPVLGIDLFFRLLANKSYQKMKRGIQLMHDFTDNVIVERRTALEKSISDGTYKSWNNEVNDMGIKRRMAFLDVLLQSTVGGQPLTNGEIREEVDTFMFEGHDTTTSGISHTLYLLARHPEVQQKALEEILQVIGSDKDKSVDMRELQDLKYLDCVIKESLRLYPPVPMIGRMTEQDVTMNGKNIPANVQVHLLIYAACRDPDYFANPDEFVPERFTAQNTELVNPFACVPFSAGPRNCIGQKFAILEMKSVISKMLRHYELLPLGTDVVPVMNLILRSATGINVGLKPRVYMELL